MRQYKMGLVIGRFQPFHLGHKYLVKKALEISDNIIIGIGSSNRKDFNNPINFPVRKKMLMEFIRREKLEDRVLRVISIPDVADDNEWFRILVKKAGKFDLVIGNNDWVNNIFLSHKYLVVEIPYYKRDLLEGKKIRQKIRNKEFWENAVPPYLHAEIRMSLGLAK